MSGYNGAEHSTSMVLHETVDKALAEVPYTEDGFPVSGDAVTKAHHNLTGFAVSAGGVLWV